MAEFNIPPTSKCQEFTDHVRGMLNELSIIAAHNGCELLMKSSVEFEPEHLQHEQALNIGCSPDYNIYTGDENPQQTPDGMGLIRTSSMHIHASGPIEDPSWRQRFIRYMDLLVGIHDSYLFPDGHERRLYYGRAGAFRPKPYGAEYRVCGSQVFADMGLVQNYANNTLIANKMAIHAPESLLIGLTGSCGGEEQIQMAINDSDRPLLLAMLKIIEANNHLGGQAYFKALGGKAPEVKPKKKKEGSKGMLKPWSHAAALQQLMDTQAAATAEMMAAPPPVQHPTIEVLDDMEEDHV